MVECNENLFLPSDKFEKVCYTGKKQSPEVFAMFRSLFNPDNPLMITMSQITDCIFLSLFWLLGCVPVVTIGTSFAALYDSVYQGFRNGNKHPWQRFFHTYKTSLVTGVVPTLLSLSVFWALARILIALWNAAVYGYVSWMVFSGGAFAGVLVMGILSVMFPMLSRFENSLGKLINNTVLVAMANMPRTLALGLVNLVAGFLCIRFVFPVFFLPALAALIGTLFVEPMFRPYMPGAEEKHPRGETLSSGKH